MTLKEFLRAEDWAVYRVHGSNREFYADTAFGPMWKTIPNDVIIRGFLGKMVYNIVDNQHY